MVMRPTPLMEQPYMEEIIEKVSKPKQKEFTNMDSIMAGLKTSSQDEMRMILEERGYPTDVDTKTGEILIGDQESGQWLRLNKRGLSTNDLLQGTIESLYLAGGSLLGAFGVGKAYKIAKPVFKLLSPVAKPIMEQVALKYAAKTALLGTQAGGAAAGAYGVEAARQGITGMMHPQTQSISGEERLEAAAVAGALGVGISSAATAAYARLMQRMPQWKYKTQWMASFLGADTKNVKKAMKPLQQENRKQYYDELRAEGDALFNRYLASAKSDPADLADLGEEYTKWMALADGKNRKIMQHNIGMVSKQGKEALDDSVKLLAAQRVRDARLVAKEAGIDVSPSFWQGLGHLIILGATGMVARPRAKRIAKNVMAARDVPQVMRKDLPSGRQTTTGDIAERGVAGGAIRQTEAAEEDAFAKQERIDDIMRY